jgi:integrase
MSEKIVTEHRHLYQRGNIWWIQAMRNGVKFTKSTGVSNIKLAREIRDRELHPMALKEDKDFTINLLGKIAGAEHQIDEIEQGKPALTIEEAWDAYLGQPNRPDSGEGTLRNYEAQFRAFASWLSRNRPNPKKDKEGNPLPRELRSVTQEEAEEYAGILSKAISASTYNRHLNALALVWRVLHKTARTTFNPWMEISRKRFVVHSRRELTLEELARIIEASTGEMRILIALGVYTGLRLGDAACLKWSDVDMARGIISLIPRKNSRRTKKRVVIPIHNVLHAMLSTTPVKERIGFVLPDCQDRFNQFDGALSKDVLTLFQSVDIVTTIGEDKPKKSKTKSKDPANDTRLLKDKKRKVADCGYHSLRHTFVSLCAAGGVAQSVVQSLVGHGSPAMTQHYTHIGLETAQNAIAMLPSVTGKVLAEEKSDAKLDEMKRLLTGLTNKGLTDLLKATQQEITIRKKTKKPVTIDVAESA